MEFWFGGSLGWNVLMEEIGKWFSKKEEQSTQKRKEVNDGVKRRQTEERL